MNIPRGASWSWRNILKPRKLAKLFVNYLVPTEKTFLFGMTCDAVWFAFNNEALQKILLPHNAKVSALINDHQWNSFAHHLPVGRTKDFILNTQINSYLVEEAIVWNSSASREFSEKMIPTESFYTKNLHKESPS